MAQPAVLMPFQSRHARHARLLVPLHYRSLMETSRASQGQVTTTTTTRSYPKKKGAPKGRRKNWQKRNERGENRNSVSEKQWRSLQSNVNAIDLHRREEEVTSPFEGMVAGVGMVRRGTRTLPRLMIYHGWQRIGISLHHCLESVASVASKRQRKKTVGNTVGAVPPATRLIDQDEIMTDVRWKGNERTIEGGGRIIGRGRKRPEGIGIVHSVYVSIVCVMHTSIGQPAKPGLSHLIGPSLIVMVHKEQYELKNGCPFYSIAYSKRMTVHGHCQSNRHYGPQPSPGRFPD